MAADDSDIECVHFFGWCGDLEKSYFILSAKITDGVASSIDYGWLPPPSRCAGNEASWPALGQSVEELLGARTLA